MVCRVSHRRRGSFTLLTAVSGFLVAGAAYGQDGAANQFGYAVSAGVGTSDNIERRAEGTDETMGTAGINFSLLQNTRRIHADVTGDFSYLTYLDDTYDDELIGSFVGTSTFTIVPERVEWLLADTFGQSTQQAFATVTPENRENINYLTTGPRFTFAAGSAFNVELAGTYTKVSYEETDLDSDRLGGDLGFIRELSSASNASLNFRYEDVDFDNALNDDFQHSEAFVRFETKASRTTLGVELGYNEVEVDRRDSKNSGTLARLQLSRQLTPSQSLSLTLGREISDAGNLFQQLESAPNFSNGTQAVQATSDPLTSKYITLGWAFQRNRTGFGASAARFEEDYETGSALDSTRQIFGGYFSRQLTPRVNLYISADHEKLEASESDLEFSEMHGAATVDWQVGRRMSLQFQYERIDRDAETGGDSSYEENRVWLRLAYGGGSERSQTLPAVQTGAY